MELYNFLFRCDSWHKVRIYSDNDMYVNSPIADAVYSDINNIPEFYLNCYVLQWNVFDVDDEYGAILEVLV